MCNRDGNGQSNSDSSSGSNPTGDLETNGQNHGESKEDGDSDRNDPSSRDGNG